MHTERGESLMVKVTKVILRVLAMLCVGFVSAVLGFIAGSMIFAIFGFEINGRQGYEAGGPLGLIAGAVIGLIGSAMLLFRKRTAK